MVVDESRILQVSIFSTLHRNEHRVANTSCLRDEFLVAVGPLHLVDKSIETNANGS
jgi:hypothetical protein